MWVKLFCGLVAVVAIILGVAVEWLSVGCHRGIQSPHQFLATKTPYLHPAQLRHHASHGKATNPNSSWHMFYYVFNYIRNCSGVYLSVEQIAAHRYKYGWLCVMGLEIQVQKSFAKL